jgi:succinate dehydrogenase/fumarate reductase flavoprotein subunit
MAEGSRMHSPVEGLDEVDVLVVGYGAAGAAAALAADEAGARVMVVEKCPQPGGNSLMSSANTVYPERPERGSFLPVSDRGL